MLEWMGLNFYYYDGLQPKIRAGIINEHECNFECNVILHTYHENFAGLKKVNDGRDPKFGYAYYLLIMPFKTRLIICTKEV